MNCETTYRRTRETSLILLSELHAKLLEHADQAGQNPNNWGFVGDLEQINSLLRRMLGKEG